MPKVVYVPLDERPCNYDYPQLLANMTDIKMIVPPKHILGNMRIPANSGALLNWLEDVTTDADHLIISIDMLVYGGIVPSRLHMMNADQCLEQVNCLSKIKQNNPGLKIHAFDLIMRTPAYNSSEEEPEYYEEYGERIFKLGWFYDKQEQGLVNAEELEEGLSLENAIPQSIVEDYMNRRENNFEITKHVIDLVDQGIIEYLIIPLDDNSEFGFTAKEQRTLMYDIDRMNLMDKINVYPGADEIGCTLFARVFCEIKRYTPEIFIRYSSTNGPFVIPRYEDRSLSESIKSHITSAGGVIVYDEKSNDFILMVHAPPIGPELMAETSHPLETRDRAYFSESNIREFSTAMKYYLSNHQNVALADVALANGSDHSLLQLLVKQDILFDLMSYAAWNTNGNTMGTVISHSIISAYYRKQTDSNKDGQNSRLFFYSRLIEDWGYQSIVRKHISSNVLPTLDLTPRDLDNQLTHITELVEELLNKFIDGYLTDIPEGQLKLGNVYLPWRRMFEVGFDITFENKQ